jgi:hypothetical protein
MRRLLMTQNRHAAQDPSELQPAPVGYGVQVRLAADLRRLVLSEPAQGLGSKTSHFTLHFVRP